ncbi:MAG: hypothetical protein B6245_07375 [Desulfobacteraceae bacterium 4572_88]|nr:MAG: hypothetical protein B6245_07375 [Desulfobacteraceae bacterium 4572_88]
MKTRYSAFISVFFIMLLLMHPVSGLGEDAEEWLRGNPDTPWHISADEIVYDRSLDQYIASGNVTITREDKKLTADVIRFDHKSMKAYAEGHVVMTAGEDVLASRRIEVNLQSETGTLYDANIFLRENHFYIRGDKIQKKGENTYTADNAVISACDGGTPAWKITGKNLNVSIEGYGHVRHATLWAKNIPVMYVPYFIFPVKLKRQSGLLLPQIGYSDRKGAEYHQPFYWAISESSDATFYNHYMSERGNKMGVEYRYILDEQSKGTLMYDFLDDWKSDDGRSGSSEKWGYRDDNALRPNSDRYWFRLKHDQAMPFGVSATLDIDIVSDQDYLHEFQSGYTGFEDTRAYFNKQFGRGFDDYSDPVRLNRLNLNRTWDQASLNAEARWYDDLISRRQGGADTTLQSLPAIRFHALKQQIAALPLYWKLDSEHTYFHREDGTRGHRTDIHPRVYLSYRFRNYFRFEPSLGLRETFWHVDEYEDALSASDKTSTREMYDVRMELSSRLFRVCPPGKTIAGLFPEITKIRHTVTPRIIYEYVSEKDQDDDPFFDLSDRIEKRHLITCSVTNTLTSRSESAKLSPEKGGDDDAQEADNATYRRFCRFKLEQSYDLDEADESDPAKWRNPGKKRPFLPTYGEVELIPARFLSLWADAEWDHYEGAFRSCNIAADLSDNRGDRLFVEHRYEQDLRESLYTELTVRFSDALSAYADYERNLHDGKEIRRRMGMSYAAQCWSADFRHSYETGDHRYAFMINLYGLGSIGSK